MRQDIRAEWTAALRSGDYKQGRNKLTRIDPDDVRTHCCLGVLCDLMVKRGELTELVAAGFVYYKSPNGAVDNTHLPEHIVAITEFEGGNNGKLLHSVQNKPFTTDFLTTLNDETERTYSFDAIADVIDAQFGPQPTEATREATTHA